MFTYTTIFVHYLSYDVLSFSCFDVDSNTLNEIKSYKK